MSASGKVILLTGCSTGIGRLAAETAARAGHRVYASMRARDERNREAAAALERLVKQLGHDLDCIDLDVTEDESIERAVAKVIGEAGRIDALVNNAGHMAIGIAEGFTTEQVRDQMDVNFLGAFRVSRAVLPQMRRQKQGLLVHVTSIAGRVVFPGCAPYCASKFALEALAEIMHYELAGQGIDSVLIEPGPFPTNLLVNSPGPADTERAAAYGELAKLRENFHSQFQDFFSSADTTDPQDVADAIVRLIDTPAGKRPLRTVCGPDFGAVQVNEATAPIQVETLRALRMRDR